MHLELTVRTADETERDVAVDAPADACVADVLATLRPAVGAEHGAGWSLDGGPLDDAAAATVLRTGAVLAPGPGRPALARGRTRQRRIEVVGGPDTGAGVELVPGRITIGRASDADLVLTDPSVSRRHVEAEASDRGVVVRDPGATHAGRLDGALLGPDPVDWPPSALLRIGDTHLALSPRAVLRPQPDVEPTDGGATAERPRPPLPVPWSSLVGGVAGGAALAAVFGSAQLLVFAVISPACLLLAAAGHRLARLRGRRARRRATQAGRIAADRDRTAAGEADVRRQRSAAPDAAELASLAAGDRPGRWQRTRDDPRLLAIRLGLVDLPPRPSVPAIVDLEAGPLSVLGPPKLAAAIGRAILIQLAVLAGPGELAVGIVGAPQVEPDWRWARWLPHLLGPPATTADDVRRLERQVAAAAANGRRVLLLVDEIAGAAPPTAGGGYVVRLGRSSEPAHTVLRAADGGARAQLGDTPVLAEPVTIAWCERVARQLAAAELTGERVGLPPACTLREVQRELDSGAIAVRWQQAQDTARAVLGIATEGPLAIDLVRDGPHALVAGTTGSGKSRLLRALVAGLAADQPPDRLALVLIDFKGGAAFAECLDLPHVAGLVTDLDPALAGRALASLRAELRRRERIFAAAGAADLAAYVRSSVQLGVQHGVRRGVPRLVVVVDEFATLTEELPEFAAGLTTIAQRGRSLGLHLVLATQRPAGSVSAEVRANCSLRIALRTTDAADSRDVLDVPDASDIAADRPGRGFVRRAGVLQPVQIADTEAPDDDPQAVRVTLLDRWRCPLPSVAPRSAPRSQLTALVEAVRTAAAQAGAPAATPPWCPPLPSELRADAVPLPIAANEVAIGLVDLPGEQRQAPLRLNLAAGGSVLLVGSARSGRTDALIALAGAGAARLDVDALHVHVLDLGGDLAAALRGLPHTGTVIGPDEGIELAADLVERLTDLAVRRRRSPDPARIMLLVDSWAQLVQAAERHDGGRTIEQLLALAHDAAGARICVAAAGDRSALSARVAGSFGVRLLLRLADRTDYSLAGIRPAAVPRSMPAGRALLAPDGAGHDALEVQLVRPAPFADCGRHRRRCVSALRIRALPSAVPLTGLGRVEGGLPFAVAAPLGDVVALPLARAGPVLVGGPSRSGRTTVLLVLLQQALDQFGHGELRIAVAAPRRSPLRARAELAGVPCIDPDDRRAAAPTAAELVLLDDAEAFADAPAEQLLLERARSAEPGRPFVAAARTGELASAYRGLAAELRRFRTALLLQPGRGDGELVGVRLPSLGVDLPPGRGCLVGAGGWSAADPRANVLRVQVAQP